MAYPSDWLQDTDHDPDQRKMPAIYRHRGGWTEHEPTGRAVVRCTCGLDSGIVAETQAVQIADDHRRTAAEARVLTA
jgi:hypothetical protein